MAEEKKRGRPRKNPDDRPATEEQVETIKKFCSYMRSDAGASMVAKRITSNMRDLESLADYLSGNGMYDPIFRQTIEQAI